VACGASQLCAGRISAALTLADRVLALAQAVGSPLALACGHFVQGLTHHTLGNLTTAREHFRQTLDNYREEDFSGDPEDYGMAARVWMGTSKVCSAMLTRPYP
jgi:hypothetical protein